MPSTDFSTTDMALAAYLSMKFPIAKLDRTDPRRVLFIFNTVDGLSQALDWYFAGKVTVDPKAYFSALKTLKSRLYGTVPSYK